MYFENDRCSHCGQAMSVKAERDGFGFCDERCRKRALKNFYSSSYDPDKRFDAEAHLASKLDYYTTFVDALDNAENKFEFQHALADGRAVFPDMPDSVEPAIQYFQTKLRLEKAEAKNQFELRRAKEEQDAESSYFSRWEANKRRNEQEQWRKDFDARQEQKTRDHEKFIDWSDKKIEKQLQEQTEQQAFQELIKSRPIPDSFRYEHTHILGGSGAGKTTLIQQRVLDDLATDNPPAMVIIDPKGFMVERISKLSVFDPITGRLRDRLVIIDATKEPLPALNLFQLPAGPAAARIRNKLVEFFEYIFSTSEAKITQRQSIPFRFVVRLVFSMGGDLNTLMDVLEEKAQSVQQSRFAADIQKLCETDDGAHRFFTNDFYSTAFNETRQQIRTRLYQIISAPHLMRMFSAKECRIDFIDCLQTRKIVLVNTGLNDFERKDSQLIGRYIIAMTLGAAFARGSIPRDQWNPAYLYIDEFQEFADDQKTPELLRLAREYNLGVTLAHQNMYCEELNDSLRTTISTNTSIKYAAAVEAQDIGYMARDLRCEADFIRTQKRSDTEARFACFVRNLLDHPMAISVPLGNIHADMQMADKPYAQLLAANATRVAPRTHKITQPARDSRPLEIVVSKPSQVASEPLEGDDHTKPATNW